MAIPKKEKEKKNKINIGKNFALTKTHLYYSHCKFLTEMQSLGGEHTSPEARQDEWDELAGGLG